MENASAVPFYLKLMDGYKGNCSSECIEKLKLFLVNCYQCPPPPLSFAALGYEGNCCLCIMVRVVKSCMTAIFKVCGPLQFAYGMATCKAELWCSDKFRRKRVPCALG